MSGSPLPNWDASDSSQQISAQRFIYESINYHALGKLHEYSSNCPPFATAIPTRSIPKRSDHSQDHACAILQRLKVEHVHRDQGENTKAGLKGKQRVSFCWAGAPESHISQLNIFQILKTRVRATFWEISDWPIWFLIDSLTKTN